MIPCVIKKSKKKKVKTLLSWHHLPSSSLKSFTVSIHCNLQPLRCVPHEWLQLILTESHVPQSPPLDICWLPNWSRSSQACHTKSLSRGAHLVLFLKLSNVCRKERWAWSSSSVEASSSSSSMMPHCTQRRRGSRWPALQTQAVASDWGNSSITKGSRWAGRVSMLVAMANRGPNVRCCGTVEFKKSTGGWQTSNFWWKILCVWLAAFLDYSGQEKKDKMLSMFWSVRAERQVPQGSAW